MTAAELEGPPAPSPIAKPRVAPSGRIAAVDVLRGFVMVLMAIDHASHTFNRGSYVTDSIMLWKPGNEIPVAQFFTRWITHLCAPVFVALAGTALAMSVEGRRARGESERAIDLHILVRGASIVVFEVVWMSFVMRTPGKFLFQVLYAIGGSLLCMTLLRRCKDRTLLGIGVAVAFGSEILMNFFAGIGALDALPIGLLVSGSFGDRLIVAYPLLPWLSMMCLGWAFGRRLVAWRSAGKDEAREATRVLTIFGSISLVLFGLVRMKNTFGNMQLLRDGDDLVQWLHVSKYPPSFTYVTLELGIGALLLAALMQLGPRRFLEPLRLLGQTALFFYLLHLHLLKLFAVATGLYEKLGIVSAYVGGLGIVLVLYLPCRWYRGYKAAHPEGWARFI